MNREEVVMLCRLVKTLCPAQALDAFTPDAWSIVLGHLDYGDAKQAVGKIASLPLEPGKARYIEPGHIIGEVRRIRDRRLAETPTPEPPAGLSASEYQQWLRSTLRQVATGTYKPPDRISQSSRPVSELIARAIPEMTETRAEPRQTRNRPTTGSKPSTRQMAAPEATARRGVSDESS